MAEEDKDVLAGDSDVTVDTVGLIAEQDVTPHAGDDAEAQAEEADSDDSNDAAGEDK